MRSKRFRGLVVCVVALLLTAACASEDVDTPRRVNPDADTGGTLTIGIVKPQTLDPSDPVEPGVQLILRLVCDRLVEFDPKTAEAKQALFTQWTLTTKGSDIKSKIRRGVLFHNEKELVAEDVAFGLSRVADKDTASSFAEIMQPVDGYEILHEEQDPDREEEEEQKTFQKLLTGVRVNERFSVQFTIPDEYSEFYRMFGHPIAAPLPRRLVEEDPAKFSKRPVCTGPYEMREPYDRATSTSIKLTRFDRYYGENDAYTRGGEGYPDVVEFKLYDTAVAAYDGYRRGEVMMVRVPAEKLAEARGLGPAYHDVDSARIEYIGLPADKKPFDNRLVRIAFSKALDRTALAEARGRTPASSFMSPVMGEDYRENSCSNNAPARADVEGARRLLERAKVNLEGQSFKFYFNDEFGHRQFVEQVAAQWKAAFGVNIEFQPTIWDTYADKARQGFDGPFRMSWAAPYPSMDQYLYPLFNSDSIGQNNWSRFSDRLFDRDIEREARRAVEFSELRQQYRQLETRVCERMPMIPVMYYKEPWLIDTNKVGSAIDSYWNVAASEPVLRELYVKAAAS